MTAVVITAVPITSVVITAVSITAVPITAVAITAVTITAVTITAVPITAVAITAVTITAVPITAVPITAVAKTSACLSCVDNGQYFFPGNFTHYLNLISATFVTFFCNFTKGNNFCNFVVGVKCVIIETVFCLFAEMKTPVTNTWSYIFFIGLSNFILKTSACPIRIEHFESLYIFHVSTILS